MDNLEIQEFKAVLLDAIFADPNKIFSGEIYAPFRWDDRFKGGTWVSQKHGDGRPSATGRGVYIDDGQNDKHCKIEDESGGFSVEILKFWEQKTGEKIPYCPQLCELYGIATPTDFAERAAQLKQQRDETQQLLADIKADYLGTAGQAVRAYAQRPIEQGGRGWDADTTKAMADFWGVVTPATAARLAQLTGLKFADNIPDTHPIVIWTLSNDNTLQYLKFRCVGSEKTGADKWRNPTGAARNNVSLYNENNIDWHIDTIIVVESEICAARATVAGFKNFVAVRGSDGLPSERVRLWWGKGCREIILLFDSETQPEKKQAMRDKLTRTTKNIRSGCADMKIKIAHIPDELNAKDIDELLSGHSDGKKLLELKVLCGTTVPAWQWDADGYTAKYKNATSQDERDDVTLEITQHAAELKQGGVRSIIDADRLLEHYQKTTGETPSAETLQRAAERQAADIRQQEYNKRRGHLFEQLKRTPADNFQQQNEIISQLNALQPPSADSETQYYGLTMEQAFAELHRDASADITTKYNLLYKGHSNTPETLPVVLYSNGITYFAGGTSHGKSTILQNIAYDLLLQGKRVLYYGFEEVKRDTLFEFINIHIHKEIPDALNLSKKGSNAGINEYLATKDPAVFDGQKITGRGKTADLDDNDRKTIVYAIREFLKQYRGVDGGDRLLYVYDDNLTSAELSEHINTRQAIVRPDAIFVDYVQFLKSESNTKTAQWEDLGEVSKDLININKTSGVPVVVAAQVNERQQDKEHPEKLNITNIYGSSTIAQGASAVYIIANSQRYDDGKFIDYNGNPETPFGQQRKMLVILAKNRFGACPAFGLFDYDGARRYINPDTLTTNPETQQNATYNNETLDF